MSSKRILVLDEDVSRRKLNAFGLRCAGFSVDEATDPLAARSRLAQCYPHLLLIVAALLDLGIHDFVRGLRASSATRELPVLALVERESAFGAATARDWGIDDFMLEPISPEGFIARVRAALASLAQPARLVADIAGLSLDTEEGFVRRGDRRAALGPTEQRLLELLLSHPDRVMPRDLLLFRIWGGAASLHSRVLDVSVCRLRRALAQLGCANLLQTVSRQGYRLTTSTEIARRARLQSVHDEINPRST